MSAPSRSARKRLLASYLPAAGVAVVLAAACLWGLLAGEISLVLLAAASDRLPTVLIRSLQLFLRF